MLKSLEEKIFSRITGMCFPQLSYWVGFDCSILGTIMIRSFGLICQTRCDLFRRLVFRFVAYCKGSDRVNYGNGMRRLIFIKITKSCDWGLAFFQNQKKGKGYLRRSSWERIDHNSFLCFNWCWNFHKKVS